MTDPHPSADPAAVTAAWCQAVLTRLHAVGVDLVVACPGYRDVPLLLAATAIDDWQVWPHPEERSAAFLAIGHMRAAQQRGHRTRAAVLTTSGSAVVNTMPAVVEAAHAGLDLIIVSGDRQPSLQGSGAPQTMDQSTPFTGFAPTHSLPLPAPDPATWRAMARQLDRVLTRPQPGPIHLNLPLAPPLEPPATNSWIAPVLPAPPTVRHAPPRPPAVMIPRLPAPPANRGVRGMIVVGPRLVLSAAAINRLANHTGYPVIVDAASGLRAHLTAPVCHADALARGPLGDTDAEVLVRIGDAPVARPLWEYCQRSQAGVIRIDDQPVTRDFCHRQFTTLIHPTDQQIDELGAGLPSGDPSWQARWLAADANARAVRDQYLAEEAWSEIHAVWQCCKQFADDDLLVLANSLAVRHANLLLDRSTSPAAVIANRGLNGIDGTIATFLGALRNQPNAGHGWLLTGDLAALHDLPALAAAAAGPGSGTIIVVDNHGGGIFDGFPVANHHAYQQLVRQPQGWNPATVASGFGYASWTVTDVASLEQALNAARDHHGMGLIHIELGPTSPHPALRHLTETMAGKPAN